MPPLDNPLGVHGALMHTDRTRHIWLNPSDFEITAGSPALVSIGPADTLRDKAKAWAFDPDNGEGIGTTVMLPADWLSGWAIKLYWAADTEVVLLRQCLWWAGIAWIAAGDSVDKARDAGNYAFGDTPSTTARILAVSAAIDLSTNAGADKAGRLTISRYATHAGDTLTGDALLLGAEIEYTADM